MAVILSRPQYVTDSDKTVLLLVNVNEASGMAVDISTPTDANLQHGYNPCKYKT